MNQSWLEVLVPYLVNQLLVRERTSSEFLLTLCCVLQGNAWHEVHSRPGSAPAETLWRERKKGSCPSDIGDLIVSFQYTKPRSEAWRKAISFLPSGAVLEFSDVGCFRFSLGSWEQQELELHIFGLSIETTYVILLRENDLYKQQKTYKMIIFLQVNTFS